MPFTLEDFVRESNRIEGILRDPTPAEVAAHERFLAEPQVSLVALEDLVSVLQPGAKLRATPGMDVRVGAHVPPRGGPYVREMLVCLLSVTVEPGVWAFTRHRHYETLHPFMDGNGRSGRALWLHDMGGIRNTPLGFLHTWYYQSLRAHYGEKVMVTR